VIVSRCGGGGEGDGGGVGEEDGCCSSEGERVMGDRSNVARRDLVRAGRFERKMVSASPLTGYDSFLPLIPEREEGKKK